jgi:hypothetical protein
MSPTARPPTAIERARLAYELTKRRQRAVVLERRMRERARNITLAVTVVGTMALMLGVAIYNGRLPPSWRSSVHDLRAEKDWASEARTAQIRSFIRGNTCQELHFNNDSGTLVGGSLVPCEPETTREPLPPSVPTGARLNSIRDAFTTR